MNNREIKFRAWEKELKQMIPIFSIDFEAKMVNRDRAWRLFNEIKLLQFTGLKDKNGKEIYEWDVIKTDEWEIASVERDNFQVTCFRMKGQIQVTDIIEVASSGFVSSDWNIKTIEVIGNIFENPELLK